NEVVDPPTEADVPATTKASETVSTRVANTPRVLGQSTSRSRPRPTQRSMKIDGTENEGWLWDRPLAEDSERVLFAFRFDNGQNVIQRMENLKTDFMHGKSKMWEDQAEIAAIKQVKQEIREHLEAKYPDRKPPLPLQHFLKWYDGFAQHHRERALASWHKA